MEKREKGAENLFEEIIPENFTNLGKETDGHPGPGNTESKRRWIQRGPHQNTFYLNGKNWSKREFHKHQEKSNWLHTWEPKTINWLFSRNFADQKRKAQYIQSEKKKIPTTKNILPGKISQIWRGRWSAHRQAKAERVSTAKLVLKARSVNRTSLSGKKEAM